MNWIAIADVALTVIDRATEEAKKKGKSAEGKNPTFIDKSAMLTSAVVMVLLSLLGRMGFIKKTKKRKESFESVSTEVYNRGTAVQAFMPVEGDVVITDKFGIAPTKYRKHVHRGIDIRADNSKLYASEDGVVVAVGSDTKSSGIFVSIEYPHDDGTIWRLSYCHLSKPLVKVGEKVKAGQVIGISGNTGSSTAPHLHLTAKKKKTGTDKYDLVDPMVYLNYIKSKGATGGVSDKQGNVLLEKTPTTFISELTQAEEPLQISSYSPPVLKKNTNAQGVARKTKNPGNMTGISPFGTGELYTHPKTGLKFTVFESFIKGYAGNAWRLLQYLGGKTRYLPKNPTLRQLVRVWVGTDDIDELTKRARDAGISNVDAKLPITFNVVLAILLALGKYDSSYCVPDEAKQGLLLAWAKWMREGNDIDEGGSSENILVNTSSSSTFINNETNRRQ